MSFLLDTNVVSEWTKARPNPGMIEWLHQADEDRVFLSVITLAELRFAVDRLPAGARRQRLDAWLRDDLPLRFESRLVPIDVSIADTCGRITAEAETPRRTVAAMDALLAATAIARGLTLVTRNVGDFQGLVPALATPWT